MTQIEKSIGNYLTEILVKKEKNHSEEVFISRNSEIAMQKRPLLAKDNLKLIVVINFSFDKKQTWTHYSNS